MLQRLLIAKKFAEKFLNERRQIVYSFVPIKKITKKVCNNIIKSLQI